ncbi:hypothetical protein E2C01_028888 [Portunus trituberculatus]|uniref:Uncharacterized protein n=1 Tax=Portunus trituberculatus TaxID=210409 RepID=A0A5B7EPY8_PORTR|nr:hypothetical protein [Portunus trituberculatus]
MLLNLLSFPYSGFDPKLWLPSPFPDYPAELVFTFAILHDLEQLVQHPTRTPDYIGYESNILDFFGYF